MLFKWLLRWQDKGSANSDIPLQIPILARSSRTTHLDCANLQRTIGSLRHVYGDINVALRNMYKKAAVIQERYEADPSSALLEQANSTASEICELQKKQMSTLKALKRTERRYTREFRKLGATEVTKLEADLLSKAQRVANAEAASLAKEVELDNARAFIADLQAKVIDKDTHMKRLRGQYEKPAQTRSDDPPASAAQRLDAWKEACRMLFQKLRQAQDQVTTLQSRLRIAEKEDDALDDEIDHLEFVVEHVVKYLTQGEKLQAVRFVRGQEGGMNCVWEETWEVPILLDVR